MKMLAEDIKTNILFFLEGGRFIVFLILQNSISMELPWNFTIIILSSLEKYKLGEKVHEEKILGEVRHL